MSAIVWDKVGEHWYETGVDHGVLYVANDDGSYANGVAWNGLTSVSQNPDGADATDFWADNIKYASMRAAEEFGGSIGAYTYPEEFEACDGSAEIATGVYVSGQIRKSFGMSYRTRIGNDVSAEAGYKLHLVYGATVSPSERTYETVNDSPDANELSWDFESTPVNTVIGGKNIATSHLVLDSRKVPKEKMAQIEEKLYGSASTEPTLMLPDAIATLIGA